MKDKTRVKDQISFVMNGVPFVPQPRRVISPTDEKKREQLEQEELARRQKLRDQND